MTVRLGETIQNIQGRLIEGMRTSKGEHAVALRTENFPAAPGEMFAPAEQDCLLAYRPNADAPWKQVQSVAEFQTVLTRTPDREHNIGLWKDQHQWNVLPKDGIVQNDEVTMLGEFLSRDCQAFGVHEEHYKEGDRAPFVTESTLFGKANLADATLVQSTYVPSVQDGNVLDCTAFNVPYVCNRTVVTQATSHKYTPVPDHGLFGKKQELVHLDETRQTREFTPDHPKGVLVGTKTWNLGNF